MATDPRDELWLATYNTWYDAYYQELLAETLISRWLKLDECTKVAAAVTSSGSAIAGLALWKDPSLTWLWPALTGVAALLAIVTDKLAVSVKLRDHGDTLRAFSTLRIDLDTFRTRMSVNPTFDVSTFEADLLVFRKRFGDVYLRVKSDALVTRSLENRIQADLNARIAQP